MEIKKNFITCNRLSYFALRPALFVPNIERLICLLCSFSLFFLDLVPPLLDFLYSVLVSRVLLKTALVDSRDWVVESTSVESCWFVGLFVGWLKKQHFDSYV